MAEDRANRPSAVAWGRLLSFLIEGRTVDPPLERLGLGLPAGQDQGVKAGLADKNSFLLSAKGINTADTLFVVIQTACRHARVAVRRRRADIHQGKPRRTLPKHDAERADQPSAVREEVEDVDVHGAAGGGGVGSRTDATHATLAASDGPPEYTSSVIFPTSCPTTAATTARSNPARALVM